jgi:hypothetical protein
MARYIILVLSNPVAGQEAAFNAWYTNTHIHDLLKCPGVVSAQRFAVNDPNAKQKFIAQYEVETSDLDATMKEINGRLGGPQMPMTPAFDTASAVMLLATPITEKLTAPA